MSWDKTETHRGTTYLCLDGNLKGSEILIRKQDHFDENRYCHIVLSIDKKVRKAAARSIETHKIFGTIPLTITETTEKIHEFADQMTSYLTDINESININLDKINSLSGKLNNAARDLKSSDDIPLKASLEVVRLTAKISIQAIQTNLSQTNEIVKTLSNMSKQNVFGSTHFQDLISTSKDIESKFVEEAIRIESIRNKLEEKISTACDEIKHRQFSKNVINTDECFGTEKLYTFGFKSGDEKSKVFLDCVKELLEATSSMSLEMKEELFSDICPQIYISDNNNDGAKKSKESSSISEAMKSKSGSFFKTEDISNNNNKEQTLDNSQSAENYIQKSN